MPLGFVDTVAELQDPKRFRETIQLAPLRLRREKRNDSCRGQL